MQLLIDVGNSNIVFALADGETIGKATRLKSNPNLTSDEYYLLFKGMIDSSKFDKAVISSVVPIITSALIKMLNVHYEINPLVIGSKVKTGIMIKADDPHSVGSDLICDTSGALDLADEGLIIDLGTATKYIYYKKNVLEGVAIAPGVSVSMKAMIGSTALLPNIELITPKKILNNNTISCMQAGVIYGFAASVDGMIDRIKAEIGHDVAVLATGGLSKLIIPLVKHNVILEEKLLLKGILNISKRND